MKRLVLALLAAAALAVSSAASAAPEPLGTALKGEAKQEYVLANALLREGDSAHALGRFRRAFELQPDPRLLFNMAICEKNLHHYAKALTLVERFLATGDALVTPDVRDSAQQFARAARLLVGEVTLRCSEADALVDVDDERADGACATPLRLDEGPHKIHATKAGFKDTTVTANVQGNAKLTVDVKLSPETHEGHLTVSAGAGDVITVDGKNATPTTWSGALPAGRHVVMVTASGKKDYRRDVFVKENDDQNVLVTLESESPKWPFYVGGGVLLVGAAIGSYFLFRPKEPPPTYGTLGGYPGH